MHRLLGFRPPPGPIMVFMAVSVLLSACAYSEPAGNFVSQRLSWVSYMDGADIEAACAVGEPDRYRLVYNADYADQARGYDVSPRPGGGADIQVQVDRGLVVDRLVFHEISDVLQIGAPIRSNTALGAAEFTEFQSRLYESGVFEPPPVGLRLNSRRFYWVVSGCHEGRFFLTGFRYPSERFDAITFDDFLFQRDRTPGRLPLPTTDAFDREFAGCDSRALQDGRPCFTVEIGQAGLVGVRTIN